MSQPPAYSRSFSFSNFMATSPSLPIPGTQVDLELNSVKATLDATLTNLARIQRDDGQLANASVGTDQLSSQVVLGFNAPTVWVTATAYAANSSMVFNGSGYYRCLVTHTSGVFATDLAAAKWQLVVNLAAIPLVAANQIAVTPSGSLTTDVQGSLQALDTGKAALSHTQAASTISDSTAAGRALLTATDVAAQNALLGTTALGFQTGDIKETATLVLQSGWYYCDGSNKNRVTDVALFNAITIQQTGTLIGGSNVVPQMTDTSSLSPGMPISGIGIPVGTRIDSVDSATQIRMSNNATVSGATPLVFAPYGVGDGSTTFGLPNRAYLGVGRDNASGSASNINQVSTTISLTSGSAVATVASNANLAVGMYLSHPNIPDNTAISSMNGTLLNLTNNATATVSGSAVRFSSLRDAQTLGAVGGVLAHNTVLTTNNLPAYTPAGTIANGAITVTSNGFGSTSLNSSAPAGGPNYLVQGGETFTATQATSTFNGSAQGGISLAITKQAMQPTIVMNYIIKR
jgi:hypothetical protein